MKQPSLVTLALALLLACSATAVSAATPIWGGAPTAHDTTASPLTLTCTTKPYANQSQHATPRVLVTLRNNGAVLAAGSDIQVTGAKLTFPTPGAGATIVVKAEFAFPSPGYNEIDVSGDGGADATCVAQPISGYAGPVKAGGDNRNVGDLMDAVDALQARVTALEAEVAALKAKQ